MSNIKDLFKSFQAQKAYVSKSLNDLDAGVESADFTKASFALQNEVVPYVDYSKPENFVFYGSAEQYYRDAFNYIRQEYPYDGSGKEKKEWERLASGFDKYIYETHYPRVNGYVTIGKDATATIFPAHGYSTPSRTEFIYFEGGPHPAPQLADGAPVSGFFPAAEGATPGSNYYNEEINQQSNLEINGDTGISLEFWLRKETYLGGIEAERQIVCDIWNNGTWGALDYGRFRVEISGTAAGVMQPNFHIELLSGSDGFSSDVISNPNPTLILSASALTGSWNHFGLTFENTETGMMGRLYQNGKLVDHLNTGSPIEIISGPIVGQIGSLMTAVSGNQGARGDGLLSASLDEFRFWKTTRTPQQIGMNWFTQINGGTNTDFTYDFNATTKYSFTNPVDLGVYYKFNEGITGFRGTDAVILDYSGRITNGDWTGYGAVVDQRSLNSAMVEAGASPVEYKDPILYSYNPEVVSTLDGFLLQGFNYDVNNNASIFQSLPSWIQDDDTVNDRKVLLKLTQIISSYFDRLQLQIQSLPHLKDVNYVSSSFKPIPFANRLIDSTGLTSTELFNEAKAFEQLSSRDDFRLFSEKLDDTKNRIYQNIYNNLVYIFKSKGAEKAFRSLIRCYGIGDELIKFNLYGDEVTHTIKENFESTVTRKRFANFYSTASYDASVYQSTGALPSINQRSFLSSSVNASFQGNTFQIESYFPKNDDTAKAIGTFVAFQTSSLFGLHTANSTTPDDTTWLVPDVANFQAYAIKTGWQNKDAIFMLTGSAGGSFPLLTSSVQTDVYDNKKWNLAVRIKPSKYPWSAAIQGSEATTYDIEFLGYDTTLDVAENQFKVTGTISREAGQSFLTSSKRAYVGAHRTNFTGSVLEQCDIRISSVRYWLDYLDDKTIFAHSKDASNYGRYAPGQNTFLNQFGNDFGSEVTPIPEIETLALQWNFEQVTGSNASGEFFVADYTSGSLASTASYGWLGPLVGLQHPGKGIDFPENNQDVTLREYVYTAKQQPPEVLNSSDMVNIKTVSDQEVFTIESRPIKYFFAVEKSMNAIISSEMIKLFATILNFNNLIGEPVNRYRQDYKAMEKMRELFFRRVKNEAMDFEKFVDYYKWVDDTIITLLAQLFPVSANFNNKVFTMIESHVLERNKYWNKFPTLEVKLKDPEVGLYGINELLYPYKRGSAPIPRVQSSHCVWAHNRADSEDFSSGDTLIDEQRNIFRQSDDFRPTAQPPILSDIAGGTRTQYEGSTYALRNFTKIYRFKADEMPVLHGGSNVARIKNVQYAHTELPFGSSKQLKVKYREIEDDIDCNDIINPNDKAKIHYKLTNNPIGYYSGKGDLFAPFSLYSSSVESGYASRLQIPLSRNCRRFSIENYHDDFYGDDKEIPIQGPFTEKYVGGWDYRHVPFTTPSGSRPEPWNLDVPFPDSKSYKFSRKTASPSLWYFGPAQHTLVCDSVTGNSWQLALWFKRDSDISSEENIISKGDSVGPGNMEWFVHMNADGTITFRVYDSSPGGYTEVSLAKNYADNQWHYLSVSWRNGTINIYGFAPQVATLSDLEFATASTTNPTNNIASLYLTLGAEFAGGWFPSANPFYGFIDEVVFWNAEISGFSGLFPMYAQYPLGANLPYPGRVWNYQNLWDNVAGLPFTDWFRLGDHTDFKLGGSLIFPSVTGSAQMLALDVDGSEIVCDTINDVNGEIVFSARSAHQPRSTILREPLAKRPVNIRNIRMTTGSTIIGNYSHDYEIVQTSGRITNNRWFVKNGGFDPEITPSPFIPAIGDYTLPDYNQYGGPTTWVFVERFNAPGGPDVSSRGALDLNAEEYAVYNNLNVRNLVVRNALNRWSSEHCGKFGINTISSSNDGSTPGEHQTNPMSYGDVIAAYHKIPRNAAQNSYYKNFANRQVSWINLPAAITYNRNTGILTTSAVGWTTGGSAGTQKLNRNGYLQWEISTLGAGGTLGWLVALNDQPNLSKYNYVLYSNSNGQVNVYDNNIWPPVHTTAINFALVGYIFRIVREDTTVFYQRSTNGGLNFKTFYTSTFPASMDLYPDISLQGIGGSVKNVKISNPRYDNWFIQHPIPQSDLQYSWINDSYDRNKKQPFGFLGSPDGGRTNFTVPSGQTSITASEVQFVNTSDFGSYILEPPVALAGFRAWGSAATGNQFIPTDFVGLNLNIYEPVSSSTNNLGYPLGTTFMAPLSAPAYLNRTFVPVPSLISSLVNGSSEYGLYTILLHRNGPYGYPSWKQIRTGETPVARYQKRNNIITVGPDQPNIKLTKTRLQNQITQEGLVENAQVLNWAKNNPLSSYVEPMVTFKYRPLETRFLSGYNFFGATVASQELRVTSSLQHTFCNNLYYFANAGLTEYVGVDWIQGADQNVSFTQGHKRPLQMHDVLYKQPNMISRFKSIIYSEVIYPKEVNTGLNKTRSRVNYAEDAPLDGEFAVADYGSNGIDRDSSRRRSFWSSEWF